MLAEEFREACLQDRFVTMISQICETLKTQVKLNLNPWIWRENERGALIGFSYSEIRFLNKNIVKCPNLNAIFRQSIYFFQFFFVLRHYR